MKAAKVEKGYIGIEDNKPAAIKLFLEKTANDSRIEIVPLAKKYPQGGEKQLVDAVIRRQVPAPPAIGQRWSNCSECRYCLRCLSGSYEE